MRPWAFLEKNLIKIQATKASLLIFPAAKALPVPSVLRFGSAGGSSAEGGGPGRHRYVTGMSQQLPLTPGSWAGMHTLDLSVGR